MLIRQAERADIEQLMLVFENAKKIMRESGNLHQWTEGYPSVEVVEADIDAAYCHLCCEGDRILATMSLIPGPEPTYSEIEGEWPNEDPYYVIHRIAACSGGGNLAVTLFDWAFEHIAPHTKVIRIDTHRENSIMKHILKKYGFQLCGVIHLSDGSPRDAYILSSHPAGCQTIY